jgi:hypothetical protein
MVADIPVLGTGKTNYGAVQKIVDASVLAEVRSTAYE